MFDSTTNMKGSFAFRLAATHATPICTSTEETLLMPSLFGNMEIIDIIASIRVVEEDYTSFEQRECQPSGIHNAQLMWAHWKSVVLFIAPPVLPHKIHLYTE